VVCDHDITGFHGHRFAQAADTQSHRAQMHGNMRRIRHKASLGVKQRAGEIETLLYVDGQRATLQQRTHLLDQREESTGEQFQCHYV